MKLPDGCYYTLTSDGEMNFEIILDNFQSSFGDCDTTLWSDFPEVLIDFDDLREFEEEGHEPELKIPKEYLL